jgi:hypothetical protein
MNWESESELGGFKSKVGGWAVGWLVYGMSGEGVRGVWFSSVWLS